MNDVIRAGSDIGDLFGLLLFIIIVTISVIVKAIEQARRAPRPPARGPQPQTSPWEEVKRFLEQAGVPTQTRPTPQQRRMQHPTPKVRPASQITRRPSPVSARQTIRPTVAPTIPPPRPALAPAPQAGPRPVAPTIPMSAPPVTAARRTRAAFASILSLRSLPPDQLRAAILLREVIGPPMAMRSRPSPTEFLP